MLLNSPRRKNQENGKTTQHFNMPESMERQ